ILKKIYHYREINGSSLHPISAYFFIRSMKTLHIRVHQQCENAMKIAEFLASHPNVENVFYPGLSSHLNHDIAKKQMRAFSGMLSFKIKGGLKAAKLFLPKLKHAHLAANLGTVETVAGIPETTSHVECTDEERKALGIPEGLIRYSVGIEDADDLIDDLKNALDAI
ncbi:PLP-dependent transferase, partial [Planctomycetota bacterium]